MLAGAALLAAALPPAARAQSAGEWHWKVGINHIDPGVRSGDLSPPSQPGTKIDIGNASSPIFTLTYYVTERFSVEGYGGLPYEHTVFGSGAIGGVGKLGTIKQVSPTVMAQYRFAPLAQRWTPYVGAGLTYVYFYGEQGSAALTALTNPGGPATHISAKPAWGRSVQAGLRFRLDSDWALDGGVIRTRLSNDNTLSTGQSISLDHNATAVSLAVSRRY